MAGGVFVATTVKFLSTVPVLGVHPDAVAPAAILRRLGAIDIRRRTLNRYAIVGSRLILRRVGFGAETRSSK